MITSDREYTMLRRYLSKLPTFKQRLKQLQSTFDLTDSELLEILDERIDTISQQLDQYRLLNESLLEVYEQLSMISDFPLVLIRARLSLGWKQDDLARRAGLKRQQINRYEREEYANISLVKAIEIARVLQKGMDEGERLGASSEKLIVAVGSGNTVDQGT
jgi:DNA-binding XRE family transcriptional regulator